MGKKSKILAAEALEWEDLLGKHRPAPVTAIDAGKAMPVVSFHTGGSSHGITLRIRTNQGAADLFLNAAVAIQIADVIRQIGLSTGWMNEAGALMVIDPENLAHPGRKS